MDATFVGEFVCKVIGSFEGVEVGDLVFDTVFTAGSSVILTSEIDVGGSVVALKLG